MDSPPAHRAEAPSGNRAEAPSGNRAQAPDGHGAETPGVEINGAKLRELRKLMGDDLKAFAGRSGITFQYLSQLELGVRRYVSPPVFARICDALGVDDRRDLVMPKTTP